jgi:hypothetical protein
MVEPTHNKTWDTKAHYNFGIRKFNIIHCQLRNEASNLKAHLFNDFLSDNTNCPNCNNKSILMSILLLFGVNVCMESNKINPKLLNLGQISKKWLLSFNEPLQFGQLVLSDISSCTQVHN